MQGLKFVVLAAFVALGGAVLLGIGGGGVTTASAGIAIAAPTGVSASINDYATKVGLNWDPMRGAAVYRIFRNTVNDSTTATDVGTTPANYFFDMSAETAVTYFYWVKAENGKSASPFSAAVQGRRAVGVNSEASIFPALEPPPAPEGNPVTAAKAALGKALFWDEQLSSTKTVSCGTCHRPAAGGSDPRTVVGEMRSRNPGFDQMFGTDDDVFGSPGVIQNAANGVYSPNSQFLFAEQVTGRRSPSYLNAGYATNGLFWDGRASGVFRDQVTNNIVLNGGASLESQAAGPPLSSSEMAHMNRDWIQVASRVEASRPLALASNIPTGLKNWIGGRNYPQLFEEAFGTTEVSPARIAMAIGTHERTLFSDRTPLDRWAAEIEPLTQQEETGRFIFLALQCNVCHSGSLLADHQFHNIGVRPQAEDRGFGAVTGDPLNDGEFKTPVLRNVELKGPFMHNGRFSTLEEVVDFYDRGGDHAAYNINVQLIRPLSLQADAKAALAAFMKRPLTDLRVRDELPPFDRPTLFTESNKQPEITGFGVKGLGTDVPYAIAVEPPLVGNPSFNLTVTTGIRSGTAVLVISDSDPGRIVSIPPTGTFAQLEMPLTDAADFGYASTSVPIANDPALVGRTLYARWYIQDSVLRRRIAVSRLIKFTIFDSELTRSIPNMASDSFVRTPLSKSK
jgi:cytochrome c peroxidase